MSISELGESEKNFLLQIYDSTKGDTSVQVSMYDIGAALDLDRDAASKLAEELIGWELVEIRTLSGGIGICANAVAEIEQVIYESLFILIFLILVICSHSCTHCKSR